MVDFRSDGEYKIWGECPNCLAYGLRFPWLALLQYSITDGVDVLLLFLFAQHYIELLFTAICITIPSISICKNHITIIKTRCFRSATSLSLSCLRCTESEGPRLARRYPKEEFVVTKNLELGHENLVVYSFWKTQTKFVLEQNRVFEEPLNISSLLYDLLILNSKKYTHWVILDLSSCSDLIANISSNYVLENYSSLKKFR